MVDHGLEPMLENRYNDGKTVITYSAAGEPTGLFISLKSAAEELYRSRFVIWHLFKRDFVAGFRQKILGYFWIVISPLIGIASFVFMHSTGILNPGETDIPYPLFVFFGTAMWGLMMGSLGAVSSGLLGNADLIMRTNIPKIALAITGMASICYGMVVNLFVLCLILLYFSLLPSWMAFFYPLSVMPILLLGIGLGLILSVIGAVARDVTGMFTTALNLFMYVTPVIYTAQFQNPFLRAVVALNPLTYLVDTPRSLFFNGNMASPTGFALSTLFSFTVLTIGIHSFYLTKDKVAERL